MLEEEKLNCYRRIDGLALGYFFNRGRSFVLVCRFVSLFSSALLARGYPKNETTFFRARGVHEIVICGRGRMRLVEGWERSVVVQGYVTIVETAHRFIWTLVGTLITATRGICLAQIHCVVVG